MFILLSQINNRERAFLVLIIAFIIFCLFKKDIRKSIFGLFKKDLIKLYVIYLFINIWVVSILWKIWFWNINLIKDTIIFVFGSWFILFVNINEIGNRRDYFTKKIKNYITFVAIFAFIINNYSFNFWVELLMWSIIIVLVWISVVAGNQKQNQVKTFADIIIWIIAFLVVVFTINSILKSNESISKLINVNEFLLPILLTLLYIPLLYLFKIYSVYESLFSRMHNCFSDDKYLSNH